MTTEEEPIVMGGGVLSEEELETMFRAIGKQRENLQQCLRDFAYWQDNHARLYYAARNRRMKSWRYLARQGLMQSVLENV